MNQAHDIADQMEYVVGLYVFRLVRSTIPALVRRDRVKSGLSQCGELMPPRISQFRKAVTQDNQRTLALFGDVHINAVGFDNTLFRFRHCPSSHPWK
jgi:hypothetical protein